LQAFGLSGGLCGLANVLQCGISYMPSAKKCGGQKQMWCIPLKNKKINAPLLLLQKG